MEQILHLNVAKILGCNYPLCPLDFTVSLDGTCFVSKSSKSSGAIATASALLIPPALIYMTTLHQTRAVPKMHPTIERLLAKKKLARTNPKPCSRSF